MALDITYIETCTKIAVFCDGRAILTYRPLRITLKGRECQQ